jgi:putative ABC transport system ATP-binding protein
VPTKGNIFLDGKNIANLSESKLAQLRGKKIGFVFQQFNLINTLTALENVMLPMTFQGITLGERKKRAKELLGFLELGGRMDHKPNELSGGEQQRVAIARALANDPEIILADEPTGNLDSKTGKYIMDLLGKLNKEKNKTIVMVTHDMDLVNYANKAFHLKDGMVHK